MSNVEQGMSKEEVKEVTEKLLLPSTFLVRHSTFLPTLASRSPANHNS